MRGAFNDNDVLWQGIVAQDGGSPSVEITNAEFRDARYAVMLRDGQANISRATFENCVFGLSLSSNDRDYAFDSLVFRNNAVGFECDFCGATRRRTNSPRGRMGAIGAAPVLGQAPP
jgi:hypothetical protein